MASVSLFIGRIAFCLIIILSTFAVVSKVYAEGQHHRLVIHVNENSASKYHMVLNIVQAVTKEARSNHDTVEIEIVAHGPGLNMMRLDKSPVKKRIGVLDLEQGNIQFSACGNTMARVAAKEGKEVRLIPEARKVPSGVYRLLELQEAGWIYIRP